MPGRSLDPALLPSSRWEAGTQEIAHRKVAGLAPRWATFRGTSILFRPIGDEPADTSGGDAHQLYGRLARLIDADDALELRRCGYCALPPDSYHMTFSDLVHDGNLSRMDPAARPAFGEGDSIAAGSEYPEALQQLVAESGILSLAGRRLVTAVDTLSIRTGSALVAEMHILDAGSADHRALAEARERLDALLLSRLGIVSPPFRPHVTLGYFANKTAAADAKPVVRKLRGRLDRRTADLTFTFSDPTACTFGDMTAFIPFTSAHAGGIAEATGR